MAVPVFMQSDSRLVGISYPWVRTPTALYSQVPITNFRGVDRMGLKAPPNKFSAVGRETQANSDGPKSQCGVTIAGDNPSRRGT